MPKPPHRLVSEYFHCVHVEHMSINVVWIIIACLTLSFSAPLDKPSGRWGQTLCPIDPQTAILIGGQGARMQFCKDPIWKLCTGKHFTICLISVDCNILLNMFLH